MKKYLFGLLVLISLLFVGCTAQKTDDVITENRAVCLSTAPSDRPIVSYGSATNVIIFICFSDEDPNAVRASIPADFRDRCNGEDNSIKDYYNKLSYGKFTFTSLFPTYNDGTLYIYRDSHPRSYYTGNSSSTGSGRTGPESTLLNNAVYEASVYLDLSGKVLDMNADGYVDCVTFLISGDYNENNWNKIMWPHSWQLDDITKEYNSSSASASLNGKKVNDYTFLFIDTVSTRVGLMCHELGHAVGSLPDLYHYKSSYSQYLPVGYWDLMHLDCATPQFMTTYIRQKYLSFVEDNQIVEMEKSGDYTLTPVTTTGKTQTLAYKLTIDNGTNTPNESIWIEYRRNDVSTYDSDLTGSGLLIYRVNTNAEEGNKNARYQNDKYPDEVFVFRPDMSKKSSITEKEKENLSYAYVSAENTYFPSLGDQNKTTKYDPTCIYLSNGKNTGIVVTIVEESAESVTFHIELGSYDASEIDYSASYVQGNTNNKNEVEIYYGDDIKSQISLFVKRRNRGIYRASDDAVTLLGGEDLYEICENGKNAYIEYTDDFGTYRFSYLLIIHDRLIIDGKEDYAATVINLPDKVDYTVGESLSLRGLVIQATYLSGVRYLSYSADEDFLWTTIGFDPQKSGVQDVTVTFNGEVKVHFTVLIHSDIVSIRVDEKNTRHIKSNALQPYFNVIATYADGMEYPLTYGDFAIEKGPEDPYAKTTVTLRAVENENAFCSSYYYYVPMRITGLSMAKDPKKSYRYGEALDLSDGKVQVSFGTYPNGFSLDGDNALPLENYYSLITDYAPSKVGKQTVRFSVEDGSLSFDVSILPLPDQMLSCLEKTVRISESASVIILDKDYTLTQLNEILSCYLDISYTYSVGKDTFNISLGGYGDLRLFSDVSLLATNSEGVVIKKYAICRSGDGNDDGTVDENDVEYWNRAIVNKETVTKGILFDKNGDNRYTLTDYVLLMDELEEKK